jgi:hypothetical protein
LQPDGVIVYDIQDEKSRSGEERPFPFLVTHEPRLYAQLLVHHSARDRKLEPVVYRAHQPHEAIRDDEHIAAMHHWLEDVSDFKIGFFFTYNHIYYIRLGINMMLETLS